MLVEFVTHLFRSPLNQLTKNCNHCTFFDRQFTFYRNQLIFNLTRLLNRPSPKLLRLDLTVNGPSQPLNGLPCAIMLCAQTHGSLKTSTTWSHNGVRLAEWGRRWACKERRNEVEEMLTFCGWWRWGERERVMTLDGWYSSLTSAGTVRPSDVYTSTITSSPPVRHLSPRWSLRRLEEKYPKHAREWCMGDVERIQRYHQREEITSLLGSYDRTVYGRYGDNLPV